MPAARNSLLYLRLALARPNRGPQHS